MTPEGGIYALRRSNPRNTPFCGFFRRYRTEPVPVTPQGDQREMKVERGSRPVEKSGHETQLVLEESDSAKAGLSGIIKEHHGGLEFAHGTSLSRPKSLDT